MISARCLALVVLLSSIGAAAWLVAACDSSGTEAAPPEAGADATIDVITFEGATPGPDAHPTDAGGPDGADAAVGTPAFGTIDFSQFLNGGGAFVATFYAVQDLAPPSPLCTVQGSDAGSCVVTTCSAGDGGAAGDAASDAGPVVLPTAGTLTVTGGAFGDSGTPLDPSHGGPYFYNTTGAMFAAGETLGVSASGGAVPAFAEQTVIAPATIVLSWTQPAGDAGGLVIPTSQDLVVTWTGGLAGSHVVFKTTAFSTATTSIACVWDAAAGQGTIPQSVLSSLSTATSAPGAASWYQQTVTAFDGGAWPIRLSAETLSGSAVHFQ